MEGIEARNNVKANGATIPNVVDIIIIWNFEKKDGGKNPSCQGNRGCKEYIDAYFHTRRRTIARHIVYLFSLSQLEAEIIRIPFWVPIFY